MTKTFNGAEWAEITYPEITKGMRILLVSEGDGVTSTLEGVADERTEGAEEAWWCKGAFLVGPDMTDHAVYTTTETTDAARRPIKSGDLFANIGATIERTETFEIIADTDTVQGWSYRGVPGAKTRHVVIKEADPDASILATIRKSLDVTDPAEADEMARQVLDGLRAAGVVS